MLISLIAATLIALLAGLALPRVFALSPAMWVHVALAVGVMPLISAAMLYFAPVLTHGRAASPRLARLPWLMLTAGLLAVAVLGGHLGYAWISLAASLALVGTLILLAWMRARVRTALGPAHPGLAWYVAALACLGLGLLAAALMPLLPVGHAWLRAFHLTINLYGFVALTAVGTLQVLMPTAVGEFDPGAGPRLRTDLKWALGSALLMATGEASAAPILTWLGAAGWGGVLLHMLSAWWRLHRRQILAWHGAAPALAAATLGLGLALVDVALNGAAASPLKLFLPGFLMPLVSGAAGQLAPVWLAPGRRAERIVAGQQRLNRWAGIRALLFLSAAVLPLLGYKCAGMPALTALVWFGLIFIVWLWREED